MTTGNLAEVLGAVAGTLTTMAFVPQVIKIWKQGGRDLSYGILTLYLSGALLWFFYGLLRNAPSIVFANGITVVLISLATFLKAWTANRIDSAK